MARFSLEEFTNFLSDIDLTAFRERYALTKILERDLPRNIQALNTIYAEYWNNVANRKHPLSFEEYYDNVYYRTLRNDIEYFWHEHSGFGTNCDCFKRGLRARIYRTWASLITQIHGGYVAESVFGNGCVQMSADLDHSGIDFLITTNGHEIKIQVKKETARREIARMDDGRSKNTDIVYITYNVPPKSDFDAPKYKVGAKKGLLRNSLHNFVEFNKNGTLKRLPNGFVVFTENAFKHLQ